MSTRNPGTPRAARVRMASHQRLERRELAPDRAIGQAAQPRGAGQCGGLGDPVQDCQGFRDRDLDAVVSDPAFERDVPTHRQLFSY
jgi:hypothetical protein